MVPRTTDSFDRMGVTIRILLVLVGLLVAEAALQIATVVFPSVEARLSGLKPRYVSDPRLYVRGDISVPEYDDLGFRNETRHALVDIVAIGDSQTEGSGVARDNAWPQQLARRLDATVYQMAFGSYGPGHYLALIDDALALQPHTVIIALYTGNDLAGAYDWVYGKGRDPDLRTDSAALQRALERAERERGPIDRAWRMARDAEKGLHDQPMLGWLRANVEGRSKIVALYEQVEWRISGRAADLDIDAAPTDWTETMATLEGVPRDMLYPFDDGVVRTVFTPQARLNAQDLDDARVAEGWHVTLAAIERIATSCRGRARLFVLLMPTKELVFAEYVRAHETEIPDSFSRLAERETAIRAQIEEALRERGVETIDPLPAMRTLLSTDAERRTPVNPYSETWDGHPVAAGYAAVSLAVSVALSRPPA
jgi:lysophospholipase L1-like esterase